MTRLYHKLLTMLIVRMKLLPFKKIRKEIRKFEHALTLRSTQ